MNALEKASVAVVGRSLTLSKHQRDAIRTLERLCDEVEFKSFAPPFQDGYPQLVFYVKHARGAHDVHIDREGRIVA